MAYLNNFQRGVNIKYEYFWHFNQLAMSFAMRENENAAKNLKSLQDFDASTTRLLHLIPNLSQNTLSTFLEIYLITQQKGAKNNQNTYQYKDSVNTYNNRDHVNNVVKSEL